MKPYPWSRDRLLRNKDGTEMPCRSDCEERSATCHATCKRYLKWEAAHMKEVEENMRRKDAIFISFDGIMRNKAERAKRHYGY